MTNLTPHVLALPLAKRLKELGVKQESLFRWWGPFPIFSDEPVIMDKADEERFYGTTILSGHAQEIIPKFSAYLASELGMMLPQFVTKKGRNEAREEDWSKTYSLHTYKERDTTFLRYVRAQEDGSMSKYDYVDCLHDTAGNEADARGAMLIYLLENGLLDGRGEGK